jgi:hypothetical protein
MLPARENLTLSAAAQYVATRCRTSIDAARAAIKGALEDAALNPTGRKTATSTRSNIEFFDWQKAVIAWEASSAEVRGRYVSPSWSEIELSRFQIDQWLRIAELRAASSGRNRQGTKPASLALVGPGKNVARTEAALARRQLGAWYQDEWIPACKAEGKVPSRDEDWAAAKARFGPHVPRTSVREIRKQKAPPEWRRRGRRTVD